MVRNCSYVKADGRPCGSPALRDRNFCYFHYQVNRPRATVPPLENADAIQLALTDLARAVLAETVDLKRAKVLAYILQTASSNLRRVQLGLFVSSMITVLPAETAVAAELDAAYTTLTPRANGESRLSAGETLAPHKEPVPAEDVMLTGHSCA